jgi:hypothetical protein
MCAVAQHHRKHTKHMSGTTSAMPRLCCAGRTNLRRRSRARPGCRRALATAAAATRSARRRARSAAPILISRRVVRAGIRSPDFGDEAFDRGHRVRWQPRVGTKHERTKRLTAKQLVLRVARFVRVQPRPEDAVHRVLGIRLKVQRGEELLSDLSHLSDGPAALRLRQLQDNAIACTTVTAD